MSGGNVHAFARRGDLKGLQQQVEEYAADVNQADVHKMTPLHYGAKRGNLNVVQYLVLRNADKEMRNGTGQTALLAAAQSGQSEVVDYLISSGADPNAEADHGVRPLHRAAAAGYEDVVRVLIKGRADPLAIDGFLMESAVHHAAREGHADVVRALMGSVARPQKGLDDDEGSLALQADYQQQAFLESAGKGGTGGVAGFTGLRATSVDAGNSRGETALHLAAAHGRVECVRLLLKMSTESWKVWWIERKDGRTGDTALHRACAESRTDVVRLLLDEQANPSLTNQLGRTPLHLAVKAGESNIVKYLMRAGASHMSIDLDGRRPVAAVAGEAGPWSNAPPDGLKVDHW